MSIKEIIKNGESKQLELKIKLPSGNSIAKTVIAFSNTSGGKLIIGVNSNLEIVGIDENKVFQIEEKISSIIYDLCYPNILPEIYTVNIDDKILLVIEIFRGNLLPYYLKNKGKRNGTFIRIGSTNRLADETMIMELERQRQGKSFDEEENFDFNIKSLNLDILFNKFKQANKKTDYGKLKNLKLIKTRGKKDYPVNALLIILGRLDNSIVKCARFKGRTMEEFIDKKEFNGTLFDILDNVINFLKNHLNLSAKIKDIQRTEEYEIPVIALREALLNALIHRDYTRSRDIKVAVYDDIVEIISPGGFPNGITLEDISNGRSELRNKVLANVFKVLGYIETWGSGIARIKSVCEKNGTGFSINEKGDFVEVIFKRLSLTGSTRKRPQEPARDRKRPQEKTAIEKKFSLELRKILSYLNENEKISRKEVMALLNCKETKAKNTLKELVDLKLIIQIKKGKYTYYIKAERG